MPSFGKILALTISFFLITINLFFTRPTPAQAFTTPPVYEITTGVPDQWTERGWAFLFKLFDIDYDGEKIVLSSNPDGTGDTLVDDAITINITHPDGSRQQFKHIYNTNCSPLTWAAPIELSNIFQKGKNHLQVILGDVCGNRKFSSPLYLVIKNQSPIPTPSPSPSPSGPVPFLDLPWDYSSNGMSFNDAATSINSYFDHTYPLLSSNLIEPNNVLGQLTTYENENSTRKFYSSHDGYDYGAAAKTKLDTPVLAPASGEATYMSSCGACGNAILIDHKNGYQTRYYHLQPDGLITNIPGQKVNVAKNQQIGKVGYTGNVSPQGETGSHLHFMLIQDKNNDGNFEDNIPDGITDPFGWQSTEPDPWENYSFNYTGQQRTGNKSYYLFTKKLDNLNETLSSNAKVFEVGKTKLEFPENSTNQNLNLSFKSEPNFISNSLNSLGSIMNIIAKDPAGIIVTSFLKSFNITIDFSQFDLSRYNLDTLSIYSSPDGENWTKENTQIDLNNSTATTSVNHLTYFALMGERRDSFAPTTTAVLGGQKGTANNFRSDVTLTLSTQDNPVGSGIEFTAYGLEDLPWQTYTTPLTYSDQGSYKIHFYSQDKDGNLEETKIIEFSIDKTPPEINVNSPTDNSAYLLDQPVLAEYSCTDQGGAGLQSCTGDAQSGGNINTQSVGEKTFKVTAVDNAGNQTTKDVPYKVQYNSSGLCNGEAGHSILQPINPDGTSIFKQGSTIPAKFRVCHNGVPVSDPGLVKSFNLIKSISDASATPVNEPVDSTNPDPNFRFDSDKQQWIFNMNTKNLSAGKTYFYKVLLNDLTDIQFSFGLR